MSPQRKDKIQRPTSDHQLSLGEHHSEGLRIQNSPHGAARDKQVFPASVKSARSISVDGRDCDRGQTPSCYEEFSVPRGRTLLRSRIAEYKHDHPQEFDKRQHSRSTKHSSEDDKHDPQGDSANALEIFNGLLRRCDIIQRFAIDHTSCFATTKGTLRRCSRPICRPNVRGSVSNEIRAQIAELSKLRVSPETLARVKVRLMEFVELVICTRSHRDEYRRAIDDINNSYLSAETAHIEKVSSLGKQGKRAETTGADNIINDSISALDKFNEMFPRATEWFDQVSNKCLWDKATEIPNTRCGNRIVAKHKTMIKDRFKILETLPFGQHISEASQIFGELADLAFCRRYHGQKARVHIHEVLGGDLVRSQQGLAFCNADHVEGLSKSQSSLDRLRSTSPDDHGARSQEILLIAANPGLDRYDFRPTTLKQSSRGSKYKYIPRFVKYETKASKAVADDDEWILQQARSKFTKSDERSGYIYAFWNRASFGYYKIGLTTLKVNLRLEQWIRQCKHDAEKVYPPIEDLTALVPHVRRVEKLIHAELRRSRLQEKRCPGCGKSHVEWFTGFSHGKLTATIQKWIKWMRSKPYRLRKGNWKLSKAGEESLRGLCKEMKSSRMDAQLTPGD